MNRHARRKQKSVARRAALVVGSPIVWTHEGIRFEHVVEAVCQMCGAAAVVKLPPSLRAAQPDDTTHVCLPAIGGCNQGYADDRYVVTSEIEMHAPYGPCLCGKTHGELPS